MSKLKLFTRGRINNEFSQLVIFGESNNWLPDKLCASLLAISPILQHYKGIFFNAGVWILILVFPYVFLRVALKLSTKPVQFMLVVFPLIIFQLYKLVDPDISFIKMAHIAVIIFYFIALANECININFFLKSITFVCVLATILVLVQYVCFYGFGYYFEVIPSNLLSADSIRWVSNAKIGLTKVTDSVSNLYRPSAFFLEPSHFFLYTFPSLFVILLSPNITKWRFKMACFLTIGIFLSTSGMGIAVAIGCWILYLLLYRKRGNQPTLSHLLNSENVLLICVFLVILLFLYINVDFVRQTVARVPTAISGRTTQAVNLLKNLDKKSLFLGSPADVGDIDFHMPGFFTTLYRQGIIGVFMSYIFYFVCLIKLRKQYFWFSVTIILISFFTAHTHGTFYMLYFVSILMIGFNASKEDVTEQRILKV